MKINLKNYSKVKTIISCVGCVFLIFLFIIKIRSNIDSQEKKNLPLSGFGNDNIQIVGLFR